MTDETPTQADEGEESHRLAVAETLAGDLSEPSIHSSEKMLQRGELLGRYVVLDTLGRGGMGIVYAAYDPHLDRKVALKLLLPGSDVGQGARHRLQREAQAIAQLAHPNVVAVHDVEAVGDRVFIAMEFVDGISLDAWLKAESRRPAEILELFIQAGMGLSAAHAAGLVHRDFKPENVLVGNDGRARVVDFGLVRRDEGTQSISSVSVELELEFSQSLTSTPEPIELTAVGSLIGTPAYMSPEQFAGGSGDLRSDQFSFCVSLHEALYGERPFAGETPTELALAVTRGEIRDPPPTSRAVPSRLRRVLLRGLAAAPERRYPSMDTLLHALRRAAAPRRLRWGLGGLALVGLAASVFVTTSEDRRCVAAIERAESLWSLERRGAIERAFVAIDRPYAAPTWDRVQTRLDEHMREWSELDGRACEDSDIPELESRAGDPRRVCLSDRLRETSILLDALERADEATVTEAVRMIRSLRSLDECMEPGESDRPWPSDPKLREHVQEARDGLQRANLLLRTGHQEEVGPLLRKVEEQARALEYDPLSAEVAADLADFLDRSDHVDQTIERYNRAFELSLRGRHDRIAFRAATALLYVYGVTLREPARAHPWGRRAEALLGRVKERDQDWVVLQNSWATVYASAHEDERALAMYEEALVVARGLDDPLAAASVLNNLGALHGQRRHFDEAAPYLQESIETTGIVLGEDHPSVLNTRANVAIISIMGGKYEEGRVLAEEVLARQEAVFGVDHIKLVNCLEALGVALMHTDEIERSEALRRRVIDIRERAFGRDHPLVVQARSNLVTLLTLDEDRNDEAEALLEALRSRFEETSAATVSVHVNVLYYSSVMELRRGRPEQALAFAEQAKALCARFSCSHGDTSLVTLSLGNARLAEGDETEARARFQELLADTRGASSIVVNEARFGLARVSVADSAGPEAALALAREALQIAREGEVGARVAVPKIEAWLREHE